MPNASIRTIASAPSSTTGPEEKPRPLAHVMAMLHYYAVIGFEDGILYEVKLAENHGATRGEILDVLAFAFIHGNPLGMRGVALSSMDYLKTSPAPPAREGRWPADWSFDADAFTAGIFSVPCP